MGRREVNAERTRTKILRAARSLFAQQGFVDTSMESIAGAADVGTSTLYRYFPTKDSLLLGLLGSSLQLLANEVEIAPHEEELPIVLTRGIAAVLAVEDRAAEQTLQLRALIDESPAARAALWDEITTQERRLTQAIAERTGESAPPYAAMITARVAVSVVQMAADIWRADRQATSSTTVATEILHAVQNGSVVLPLPVTSHLIGHGTD